MISKQGSNDPGVRTLPWLRRSFLCWRLGRETRRDSNVKGVARARREAGRAWVRHMAVWKEVSGQIQELLGRENNRTQGLIQ